MAAADGDPETVEGPLLEPDVLERREYQVRLAEAARRDHTLVCLPTGLGKTAVSLLVTAARLHERGGKALLLAPTKPLVTQHAQFYREALSIPAEEVVVFTGEVRPDDRRALWADATVVVATPQVVENDLVGSRISLADVTHLTFDECHRATGEYAYNYIAERYHADADDPLVTGMSASPGGDADEIRTVCANLGIREVEVMTAADADVAAHTYETELEWVHLDLPEAVLAIRDALEDVVADRLATLAEIGVTSSTDPQLSQRDLNRMRGRLQGLIDDDRSEGYTGMSVHAEIMKLRRAIELVETQSVESLCRYFERQRNAARSSGASKASQRFVSEPRVREAMDRAAAFDDLHPKFRRTRMLLAETLGVDDGDRVIVFTESRDTAEALTDFLSEHFDTRRFVGQGDKEGSDGMTQTEQAETLDAFRAGAFEVLVSTSVAEEGLDVPDVDLVLFYEPVPKGIRSIQRKGRTGRAREGRVVVLIANDTRDEAFFWMSRREEKEMESELRSLADVADEVEAALAQADLGAYDQAESSPTDGSADGRSAEPTATAADGEGQTGLDAFAAPAPDEVDETGDDVGVVATARPGEAVEIVVDQRELDSHIARDLSTREGIETRLETLQVGDYVLSDRVVVERKTVPDFLETLLGEDRSLFAQLKAASRQYARPVVVLEGEGLYGERNVHPNAIRGALAAIAVDFGASILQTADATETADLLAVIARREQDRSDREVTLHGEKASKTLAEQQEYVVAAIAEVGPVTARALLAHFGSVEAVLTAEGAALEAVDGVGPVTADRIREVVGSDYET